MNIRNATPIDAAEIAEIYNDAVVNTTAIWNDRTVDALDRTRWMTERQQAGFVVLVAEEEGRVLGYAAYGPWRAFDGYKQTVEHSIYVHKDARGKGLGRDLMKALIEAAKSNGIHVMLGGIEAGNAASIALHETFGFTETARMPQVGQKFGRWLDLVFLQLILDDKPAP